LELPNIIKLLISQDILSEYRRVGEAFSDEFPSIDLRPILDLVTIEAELCVAEDLPEPLCSDPDDDKFVACAIASGSMIIIVVLNIYIKVKKNDPISALGVQIQSAKYSYGEIH
jgi:predicted nucleic acid-binding protein